MERCSAEGELIRSSPFGMDLVPNEIGIRLSKEPGRAHTILALNTLAFTVCFAAWMLNGVLVTFLVENRVFDWSASQMGWLLGIPVLTGSLTRLPLGMATDRFGGRPVYTLLMLAAAVPMFFLGHADSYREFMLLSLGFGLTGGSCANSAEARTRKLAANGRMLTCPSSPCGHPPAAPA